MINANDFVNGSISFVSSRKQSLPHRIVRNLVRKQTLNHLAKFFHLLRFYWRNHYAYILLQSAYFQRCSHYLRNTSLVLRKVNIKDYKINYSETKFRRSLKYLGT